MVKPLPFTTPIFKVGAPKAPTVPPSGAMPVPAAPKVAEPQARKLAPLTLYSLRVYEQRKCVNLPNDVPWVGTLSCFIHKDNLSPSCIVPRGEQVRGLRDIKHMLKFAKKAVPWPLLGEIPFVAEDPENARDDVTLLVYHQNGAFIFADKALGPLPAIIWVAQYSGIDSETGVNSVILFDSKEDPRLVVSSFTSSEKRIQAAQALQTKTQIR